mmetsp:Transcript_8640/g.24276  ORF Transcript_8640/g.24276 Transcript_8640/m.24276 type:complete len:136 (+) Transcript_8640:76-483(+)
MLCLPRSAALAALAALALGPVAEATGGSLGGLPPWWLLHGVRPEGPSKSMGSYSVVTFSAEQQERFGIGEDGSVKDKARFDAAMDALRAGTLGPGSFMVVSQEEPEALGSLGADAPLKPAGSEHGGKSSNDPISV